MSQKINYARLTNWGDFDRSQQEAAQRSQRELEQLRQQPVQQTLQPPASIAAPQQANQKAGLQDQLRMKLSQIDADIQRLRNSQNPNGIKNSLGVGGDKNYQLRALENARAGVLADMQDGGNTNFIQDVGSVMRSGLLNLEKGLGYVTGDDQAMARARQEQEIQSARLTDYGREAREKGVLGDDMELGQRAYAAMLGAAESIPEMGVGALAAAGIAAAAPEAAVAAVGARALSLAAKSPRLASLFGVTAGTAGRQTASQIGRQAIATVSGMGMEGLQGGANAGADAKFAVLQQIESDPEAFAKSELGRKFLEQTGGDFEKAKLLAADTAASSAAISTGIATGLLALPGAAFEARVLRGAASKGFIREGLGGFAAEAMQEAPQSGAEQLIQNTTLQDVGSNVGTFEGVAKAAGEGAIVGGLVGGGVGVIGGGVTPRQMRGGSEDNELLSALDSYVSQRPTPQGPKGPGLLEAPTEQTTMRVGGLNLTPSQVLEFAENNQSNPRIADILSQPVSQSTQIEQIARILNTEHAARVEPEAVRRISGMIGGTNSVTNTRQFIREELAQLGEEVVNESPTLSAIRDAVENEGKGKSFVSGLRAITEGYNPPSQQGQTFVARPERGGEGSVIMTPDQTTDEAQREREAQQAFRLAERRQQRFDQATGQGTQREDIRPGAPEPEAQFFLGEAYGDMAGTAATIVEAATPGMYRIQYESPTETDANGTPVTISEEVPALDLVGRVVRGTPRMTQELAGDVRKPRKGTGTDMNPRQSVDRTTTRAIAEAQQPQPPMAQPMEPNLTMTGRQEQPFQYEAQPSLNAQETPVEDSAAPEGTVESQAQVSGAPGAAALPAPPRGLPAPEAQQEAQPPAITEREEIAPEATAEEGNLPDQEEPAADRQDGEEKPALPRRIQIDRRAGKLVKDGVITFREKMALQRKTRDNVDAYEAEVTKLEQQAQQQDDYDNHPLMKEYEQRFENLKDEVANTDNVRELRKVANRLVREDIIDDLDPMNEAINDETDREYKLSAGQEALSELLDEAMENGRLEVEQQIDEQGDGTQYSGRTSKRKKRTYGRPENQTERATQEEPKAAKTEPRAEPKAESKTEPSVDYESVISDRLDKIAEKGAQGRIIAKRLRGLLKDKSLSAAQLYYAIRMGEVFSRVLPKNAKVDILFVPSMKATNALAAAASGSSLGAEVSGSYKAYDISQNGFRGLITMSLADNMLSVSRENAAHEAFHVIQDMLRVYDPEMFSAINNYFKDGMRIDELDPSILRKLKSITLDGNRSVYQSLIDDFGDTPLGRYEAQAVAFGALVDAKDRGENMKGLKASIARFVDMLSSLRRGLRNILRKPGSEKLVTIAEVFEGYRTGEYQEYLEGLSAPLADGSVEEQYSARTKPDPVRTQKAYKLFRVDARKPGQLFPLFVNANDPVPMGEWLDADVGPAAGNKVKSKLGPLAMRPGWHAGDLPIATHIGAKSKASLKAPDTRPDNQVWAEVEFAADRDWQQEANNRAKRNANGEIIANTAHITDQIPEDGFYRYKTNPNMTGNWLIGGSMKVTRILSDAEVEQINSAAGVSDLPRAEPFDTAKYGFEQYSGRTGNGDQGEFNKNIKPQKLSSDEIFAQPDVKQGTMNVTEAAKTIQERTLKILGRAITAPGQQDELLSKTLAHEVKAELQRSGKRNASGWYTDEMRKATAVASLMHPEIGYDVGAQLGFTAALAITSQNQSVDFNTVYAERWYEQYKKTGKFPENEGWGKAASSIMSNAKLFNALVERFGAATVSKFFATKFSVRELKAAGFKNVSGAAEEMVYGSAVLGPKIGFGFYSNLNGRYDPITIDMWFMRTWGRVTGDLIGASDELIAEQQQRLINALRDEGRPTNAYGDELLEVAREEFKKFEKDFKDNRADYDSGKKVKSEVALAAQRLVGSFEDTKDAPKADWQRTWIRDVVAGAQQILQKDGINITNADFQAIIWYPEKRLWSKKYGVREKGKGADDAGSAGETSYFDEFVRIAKSRGFTDVQIQSAIQPARGRGQGSGGVLGGQAVNQQAGGQPSAANEFSAGEARRFIQDAIVTRINQEFPIFDGTGSGPVGQQSGHISRKSGGNLARSLEGRVPVAATYSHSLKAKNAFEVAGIDAVKFHELTAGPAAARLYHRLISEAKNANKAGAAVYVYDQSDYADMRLFLSEDGLIGFALKGNDVVSVFKHPSAEVRNAAVPLIRMATWLGGRKLDAYDTVLPRIYSTAGYRVAARIPWDDGQAEPSWDKEVFKAFNNGEPDVVFMAYDPTRTDFYREGEGPTAKDYDDAVAIQTKAVNSVQYSGRRGTYRGGVSQSMMDKVVSGEPEPGIFGKFLDKLVGRQGNESRRRAFVRNAISSKDGAFELDKLLDAALRGVDRTEGRVPVDGSSVGRMMEMASQTSGVMQAALEWGPPAFDGDITTIHEDIPGLFDIFAPIGERRSAAFQTYAVARRERDLRRSGRNGFPEITDAEIEETLRNADPDFAEVFDNYQEYNRAIIDYAIDTGLLTEELGDKLKSMDYIPYYRAIELDDGEMDVLGPNMQAALNNPKSALNLKLKGGDSSLGNLYENIIRNTQSILSAARKNLALQEAADAIDALNNLGIDEVGKRVPTADGQNIMRLRIEGKPAYYKIDDLAVWASFASLGPSQRNAIIEFMSKFANVLRSGVTLAIPFMIRNLYRGKISAYVTTDAKLGTGVDTFKGLADAYRGGEATRMIKVNSGMGGYTYGMGERDFSNEIRRRYRWGEGGGYGLSQGFSDFMKGVLVAAERIGEATEFAERVKIYNDTLEKTGNEKTAAYEALNGITNFGRKGAGQGYAGAALAALIPMIPFLNARIQGLYRIVENQQNEAKIMGLRKQLLLRGLLYTAVSTAIYAMASDDDRWDEETTEEKMLYDIFYIGDKKIRLPRPFEVGTMFGSFPIAMMDYIRDKDGDEAWRKVKFAFTNTFAMNPIPQGALPALGSYINYDFFTGRPIENMAEQNLPKEMRYDERTTETAKALGNLTGTSPKKIDYLVNGYLGTLGTGFLAGIDTVLAGAGIIPKKPGGMFGDPYAIGDSIASASGMTSFVRDADTASSRFVRDFYEMKREADQANRAFKRMVEQGRIEEAKKILKDNGAAIQSQKQLGRLAKDMTDINKMVDAVYADPNLTPAEKTLKLRMLSKQRKQIARSGYEFARGLRTAYEYEDEEEEDAEETAETED